VFFLLPIIYLVSTAFKPIEELFLFPPEFIVRHPTLDNFSALFMAASGTWIPFSRYVFNSAFVSIITVSVGVLIATMAAYPLAKHRIPGRSFFFAVIIGALMFAPQVTVIPRYIVVNGLGLIDTYGALILPALAAAYSPFLMKQFMEQIPDELIEAAKIDGASEWKIFWGMVVPMVKPAIATLLFFQFIAVWNNYADALIYTRTEAMKTLPLAIQTIAGGPGVVARQGAVAAAALLTTLPVIILFILVQKQVIQSMAYSGIKA
jgi:ABC-type glycerol-3-phosphate transport system permease component